MHEQQNIDLVKKLYEAFGKGDIKTISDHLSGQLVWRFDAPSGDSVRRRTRYARQGEGGIFRPPGNYFRRAELSTPSGIVDYAELGFGEQRNGTPA